MENISFYNDESVVLWQINPFPDYQMCIRDSLIPSFLLTGQQTPAFGRRVSGIIEIADGSRRRKAAAPVSYTHLDVYKRQTVYYVSSVIVQGTVGSEHLMKMPRLC